MRTDEQMKIIRETGIVAIVRGTGIDSLLKIAEALSEGGVRVIEVTLNTPGAIEMIGQLEKEFGDEMLIGAGTVLDPETARAVILAGAKFVIGPTLNLDVNKLCKRYNTVYIPGVLTPNEIISAWEAGAQVVKVFPAGTLGPRYIKELRGPLAQVEMMPVGGVTVDNAAEFIKAGAGALGIGGELVDRNAVETGRFELLTEKAHRFIEAVQDGRR
ncbi:MAG: bifunctional 4-hydroxy-2-oxoglutarate aldolase/2-dehydro-3-deoxy-phosphogluconate aldolase [Desulfobacterales bacterium]|nr:bifunctional 4-hydroxy-2-oxoglutarate aldolase/2-dehydro-3-deoxy-phosphogluconate aldolase [Desulfobacterales bacterium]